MAVSRIFPVRERFRVELRADFFNFMNHANLGTPASAISSATFGQITSFGGPRLIQMAMKAYF